MYITTAGGQIKNKKIKKSKKRKEEYENGLRQCRRTEEKSNRKLIGEVVYIIIGLEWEEFDRVPTNFK